MTLILKLLSPFLAVILTQITLIANGVPLPRQHINVPDKPVNILVPGMLGYGENVGLNRAVPYFGGLTGLDFGRALEKQGYETYQADVGPASSAWDRSCELYAQLTGARVDYGKAHSEKYGHARYGRTYAKPLFEGWGPKRPLNLIGHSFGANTARMLALLLDEGDAAERKATPKGELSPLFAGGMIGRVHSIITFAGPHNGTTAAGCIADDYDEQYYLWYAELLNRMGSNSLVNGVIDMQLDHFGMSTFPGGLSLRPNKQAARAFLNSLDHSFYDCSIDGAAAFNRIDRIRPSVYYFSYSSVITQPRGNKQLPRAREFLDPVLFWYSFQIGRGTGFIAPPDPTWQVNDGLVPLNSARYPQGQPHREFIPGQTQVKPGVWNMLPTLENADHAYWCGGDFLYNGRDEVFGIYLDLMARLEGTY